MFARTLALASMLSMAGPPLEAEAQARPEFDVQLLEVGEDAIRTLDPKPAMDAVVHRRNKTQPNTLRVARYQTLGLRLGLVHQRPGVRVVEAPQIHSVDGTPRSLRSSTSLTPSLLTSHEAAPGVTVTSQRAGEGRVALTIGVGAQGSVVRVVLNEGESVMVTGLDVPLEAWPHRAPQLGDEPSTRRTRLLVVTPRVSGS